MKGFKLLLYKRYFDTGFGLLNYVKYLIIFIGLDRVLKQDLSFTIYLVGIYAVVCFIVGWLYINKGYWETEQEITNRFNPFQQEIRKKLGISNK